MQKKIASEEAIASQTTRHLRRAADEGQRKPASNGRQRMLVTIRLKRRPMPKLLSTSARDRLLASSTLCQYRAVRASENSSISPSIASNMKQA